MIAEPSRIGEVGRKPSSTVSNGPPTLIVVNQVCTLRSRTPYVMSFVELWEWGIVVRMVGLTDGFVRRVLDMGIELCDDEGRMYLYRATTSGGMVLAEEVMIAFEGRPSESARVLQLSAASGDVLVSVAIPASADKP